MRIDFPYCNHHGGKIAFGPDGYLYVGVGDGGWEGDVLEAGQDLDMDGQDAPHRRQPKQGGYTVPDNNPFVKAAEPQLMVLFGKSELEFSKIKQNAKPEIWAYGIRNPWTFSFDRKTGDLCIADIGQNTWEEIDFQPAASKGGENYGWSLPCGTHPFPIEKEQTGEKAWRIAWPIAEYSTATTASASSAWASTAATIIPSSTAPISSATGVPAVSGACKRENCGKWQMQELLNTQLQLTSGGEDESGQHLRHQRHQPVRRVQRCVQNVPGPSGKSSRLQSSRERKRLR